MGRPIRHMPYPGIVFEITNRTIHGRLLLLPSDELTPLLLGALGRALDLVPEVRLHAFVFASNHFHLLLSAPDHAAISRFMNQLDSNLARIAGRLHRWRDCFWAHRYRAIPVLDDEALLGRLRYLLAHGCKEGLVASPRDWPGATCLPALLEGRSLEGLWIDRSRRRRRGQPADEVVIRYPVPLAPLPGWEELTPEERQARVRALVEDIEAETRERHARAGTRPLGADRVLAQDPHGLPREVKRRPAPACHAASETLREGYRKAYRLFASLFRAASERLRAGELNVPFPEHCFPPALAYLGATGPP